MGTWCHSGLCWWVVLIMLVSHCVVCHCVIGVSDYPQLTPESPQTPQPPAGSACVSGPAGSEPGCSQGGVRYFSVMWCKASKKKHKRWEGDAVLMTRGRTATLKDMEGKDIGKGEEEIAQIILFKSMYLVSKYEVNLK